MHVQAGFAMNCRGGRLEIFAVHWAERAAVEFGVVGLDAELDAEALQKLDLSFRNAAPSSARSCNR